MSRHLGLATNIHRRMQHYPPSLSSSLSHCPSKTLLPENSPSSSCMLQVQMHLLTLIFLLHLFSQVHLFQKPWPFLTFDNETHHVPGILQLYFKFYSSCTA